MVYLFLADGFEIIEAMAPADMLSRAGIGCRLVGVTGEYVKASNGIEVKSDILIDDISPDESIEMVILPGGMPGTRNLEDNGKVIEFVKYCYDKGKYIAAICAAPSILGHLGMLDGIKATCFPEFSDELGNAVYTADKVEHSGNIITARGAGVAVKFGLKCVKALRGKSVSEQIARAIQK